MVILTKLNKTDFENILYGYKIGTYISNKHCPWAYENTVYFITTSKGKFVLKIFETAQSKFINFQVRLMKTIEKANLPSPKIILTNKKQPLCTHKNKKLLIQEFAPGKKPKVYNKELTKDAGKIFGLLMKTLIKAKDKEAPSWGEHQFRLNIKEKKWRSFNIQEERKQLHEEMKSLNKGGIRRSIIHGDLHSSNFLASKNKVSAIIDWDDAHIDFVPQEIAVTLAHMFIGKTIQKKKIKLFMKEYEKNFKLNTEEKRAIYHFIKKRFISVIDWHIKQARTHSDQRKAINNFLSKQAIPNYLHFKKLPQKEFTKSL